MLQNTTTVYRKIWETARKTFIKSVNYLWLRIPRADEDAAGAPRRREKAQKLPRWPCAPRYNLHTLHRWVASNPLYCFQLPARREGGREACKPRIDLASRITKCGLKKDASRTTQEFKDQYGNFFGKPASEEGRGENHSPSSSSSSWNNSSMKRSYTASSSSSESRVERISSPFSSRTFRMMRP